MKVFVLTLLLFSCLSVVNSSNILMLLPLGSHSHKNIFVPLAESLSENGHDVTIVSLHQSQSENKTLPYKDVVAKTAWNHVKKVTGEFNIFKMISNSGSKNVNSEVMKKVIKHLPEYCEAFLRDPAAVPVWEVKPDLILLPAFMNECGLILVQKFKVPFMYVTTSGLTPWTADLVGNPEHPAYVPNQYLPYSDDMTLWERTINSVLRVAAPLLREHFVMGKLNSVAQKFLKDSTVSLKEVEKNVSMVLVNSHHSLGFPRPLQPNVIEIGGMHCREPRPIDDLELNLFLNSSEEKSVILFSLGSHLKSSQMPLSFRQKLINVFSKLPYKIVWKWDGTPIKNLPSNILLKNWLPQQDILGHNAIGAFFSHGGLLSTQESIYHGVPMVGLPLMSDQHLNIKQAESIGVAISLKLESLTEDELEKALTSVMEDKSYRQNVEQRSLIMKDQETLPLQRATYYVEYVLRHQGAKHLKSLASSLSLVQYYLLDVLFVIVSFLVACLASISFIAFLTWTVASRLTRKGVLHLLYVLRNQLKEH